jgi:signal transduction histidine kinase/CheY-like chemotaxis protein/HPt (histidine-containing phosphotransfer) domain-containing protein
MDAIGGPPASRAEERPSYGAWGVASPWMALMVAAVAMLALLGWVFDVGTLKSVLRGAVEMKPNTAVALLLAASSLLLKSTRPTRAAAITARVMGILVLVIGMLTLLEYGLGWRLPIDELLFRDVGHLYASFRGRMSPYSAVAFVGIGLALALPARAALRVPAILGAVSMLVIGLLSALGYLWNAQELTTDQWLPPVALNTAVAFVALGAGAILRVAPDALLSGWTFTARRRGHVEAKVLLGFVLALLLLCISGGIAYRTQARFASSVQHLAGIQGTLAVELAHQRSYTLIALLVTLFIATVALLLLFGSILRDMRERARIARALNDAQREARKATAAKSQFLAMMSHEIRTPMNGVLGMLELLEQSSLRPSQMQMLKLTRDSAHALLTIIDDILDFSKIEAGRLTTETIAFPLTDVVHKTIRLLERLAERKQVSLTVSCDPALPSALLGDPNRVRQILVNLINNAIKFSAGLDRPGQVSVHADLRSVSGETAEVELRVVDNGIGLDAGTRERLFSPFMQADASTTRRHGGTGLGLAICRQLTELMGGTIDATSEPGKGSTFRVRLSLPISQATIPDTPLPALERPVVRPAATSGPPLLVAEDSEINQKVIAGQLALLGYSAEVAENGREALEKWHNGNYSLLLADLHMPEMDGYELARAIRRQERDGRPRLPIVALTANAMQAEVERCREAGMDDYLSKPASLADLSAVIAKWRSASHPQRVAPLDVRVLESLVGNDRALIDSLLKEFDLGLARTADEIGKAAGGRRPQEAAALAHKLKSSARSVGAGRLAELCSLMETEGFKDDSEAVARLVPEFVDEVRSVEEYLASR